MYFKTILYFMINFYNIDMDKIKKILIYQSIIGLMYIIVIYKMIINVIYIKN